MDQIYTITTDNGSNMLKAVKMLSLDYDDSDEAIVEENKRANVDDDSICGLIWMNSRKRVKKNEPEDHAENILQDIENSTLGLDFSSNVLTSAAF